MRKPNFKEQVLAQFDKRKNEVLNGNITKEVINLVRENAVLHVSLLGILGEKQYKKMIKTLENEK